MTVFRYKAISSVALFGTFQKNTYVETSLRFLSINDTLYAID